MHRRLSPLWPLLAFLLLGAPACSAQPAPPSAPDWPPVTRPAEPAQVLAEPEPLEPLRTVDAATAAREAISRKDWRLAQSWTIHAPGIRCFTPDALAAGFPRRFAMFDALPPRGDPNYAYAEAYNLAIVEAPDYPDADLCRPRLPRESDYPQALAPSHAARELTRPPLTLHEAARRGTYADLRRLLPVTRRNQVDWFGMTPLAWAAVRGRSDIWAELVRNGEDPVGSADRYGRDDLYWAIVTGREDIVTAIIARTRGQLREPVRGNWLEAAVSTGNPRLVDAVFALPHRSLQMSTLTVKTWQAEAVEAALKRSDAATAERLMGIAAATNPKRDDLVRLAAPYAGKPAP